jgi:two-component system chemotaxis response regulator CheB
MRKLRVLVVEDSLTIRKYLVQVLSADGGIEVAGEAPDGKRAIELCQALRPDVVTMDMMLPIMTGVAATEYIMAYCPTPILIVSASVNRGEVFRTYEALAAGALDVLEKPKVTESTREWEQRFVSTVKLIAKIKVITHPRGRLRAAPLPISAGAPDAPQPSGQDCRLIAIGASTGGPAAVADILRAMPEDFGLPILVVIHIADAFAYAMAEWLNTEARVPVRYAVDGEWLPQPGTPQVLLAPADRHLAVKDGRLHLLNTPERHACRPSVDVLFESIAAEMAPQSLLILLTGMGRDGAAGLLAARRAGAATVAQDEATSVIFGMPGEAVRLGAAERVLALDQIATAILASCAVQPARRQV